VPDNVDYRNIPWRNARFDEEELTRHVATQDRARNAYEQLQNRGGTRTLAFCASQRHADFMAGFFKEQGMRAVAVHSGPTSANRAQSLEQLSAGHLDVICAVDVFNEGLDLPELDTVLMLRPTESRILWLQQFGRGLRKTAGDKQLTVIDYIGNHRTFLLKPRDPLQPPEPDPRDRRMAPRGVPGTPRTPARRGLVPLNPLAKSTRPPLWRRNPREQIPALFGLPFSVAIWNAGFIVRPGHDFLLVALRGWWNPVLVLGRMREGLYDSLLTARLREQLRAVDGVAAQTHGLDEVDAPARLARFLAEEVRRLLGDLRGEERVETQAVIVNQLLAWLKDRVEAETADTVASPAQVLLAIHRTPEPPPRPLTPIGTSTLLIRPGKPDLGRELVAEVASADRVDALVSFVTWGGFRRLRTAFEEHARAGRELRLLTTTYTGATEAAAVREIARLPGAKVRVSFDGRRSRIHAKAWLFNRETGFSSVWVGSANLSASALAGGLEWTMKASEADMRHVVEAFRGSFDSLWEDPEFEAIEPGNDDQMQRLERALSTARGGPSAPGEAELLFDLRPYPFQEEILEQLAEERDGRGRYRNLVVAATGTGKTMLAGFDYARQPDRPNLLFLAHREELLRQARTSFRHILRDGSFGEILTGSERPARATHLFGTIQSFARSDLPARLGADYWKYVVIDEAHHAPADSYQAVLARLRPRILLALTATPERADNQSLLPDFDGAIAAEMRL